jgi:phosphohistidine phosphatase SixA
MTRQVRAVVASLALAALSVSTASARDQSQVVVIVRHAEKADAPNGDVALSDRGRARAEVLAAALRDARVDTIVTTELRRSRETAAPLASSRGLTPVVVQTSDEAEAHALAVAEAVKKGGRVVLVVGHSNTVPAIVEALGGPQIAAICDGQYALIFTLWTEPGKPSRLIRSTYGAPDPETSDCNDMKMSR